MHILLNHMLTNSAFLVINFNSSLTGPFLKPMPLDKGADSRIRQWALWLFSEALGLSHWCESAARRVDKMQAVGRLEVCCGGYSALLLRGLHAQPSILSYCRHKSNITDASLCASSFSVRFTLVGINVSWLRMLPTGIIMTIMLGLIPCCFCII